MGNGQVQPPPPLLMPPRQIKGARLHYALHPSSLLPALTRRVVWQCIKCDDLEGFGVFVCVAVGVTCVVAWYMITLRPLSRLGADEGEAMLEGEEPRGLLGRGREAVREAWARWGNKDAAQHVAGYFK
eukprot:3932583-Rhodomonas_salina.1